MCNDIPQASSSRLHISMAQAPCEPRKGSSFQEVPSPFLSVLDFWYLLHHHDPAQNRSLQSQSSCFTSHSNTVSHFPARPQLQHLFTVLFHQEVRLNRTNSLSCISYLGPKAQTPGSHHVAFPQLSRVRAYRCAHC